MSEVFSKASCERPVCEKEAAIPKCVADYERDTTECLVDVKNKLTSLYGIITTDVISNSDNIKEPECFADNVTINNSLAMQIRDITSEIGRVLFNK